MPVEPLIGWLAATAALVAGAAMWRGLGREPWLDELATLEVVDRAGGLSRLQRDVHPPAFTLVAAWLAAGRRDWRRLRLPGALATALAATATALAAAPAGAVAVLGAGALAALSPAALRIGSDFRPYGFALLGGALGTLGAVRFDSPLGWICLAAGAALAFGSHFATAALAPGWLLVAAAGPRPLLALAPGLALLLACLLAQRESVRAAAAAWWIPTPTFRRLGRQVAVLGGGGGLGAAASLGVVALAGIGCAEELGARLVGAAALGVATLMVVSWLERPVVWPRTLLLLQPFTLAAAGVGTAVLARRAGVAVACLALALVALAASRRILAAAWTRGDEPWVEALEGAGGSEPATAIAACPPWAALAVESASPGAPALRLPVALDGETAAALRPQLAGVRRLILVVRVDILLLGRERAFETFLAGLARSPLERLRLTLVESPDREILVELRALAIALRSGATAAWGAPIETHCGPGFQVLELVRPGAAP